MNDGETIADIVAEMRGMGNYQQYSGDHARALADRIEAAAEREITQSDPDWQNICAKCKDGEIEPKYCEYYGEPNGCNSPIYGEHPTTEKTSAVGNAAVLREALEYLLKQRDILDFCHNNLGSKTWEDWDKVYNVLRKIIEKAMRALAKPPRNCDVYKTPEESIRMFESYIRESGKVGFINPFTEVVKWLFAPAAERKGESNGSK